MRLMQLGSLYLSKFTGDEITEAEARAVLEPYGAIETVWYPTKTDCQIYQLPKGIWVKFGFFQDCRDAQAVS